MKPIIVVDHVRRKFSRNSQSHLGYGVADLVREVFGARRSDSLRKDEFWAVDDVSFHLNRGDSLALVGRNGSGKSTLLRMLNGMIKPDAGSITVDGSMQALISLGAGFSPQLSGRENVFNVAALQGMTRRQTLGILDEVVSFSELEEFIDMPVGNYSSGMYARLGFSVAVHMRPEILLIDEILSVGDYAFQNKCFVKMHEIKKRGVTIVLVSHSTTHVNQICEQALWLDHGRPALAGTAKEVTKAYLDQFDAQLVDERRRLSTLQKENERIGRNKTLQGIYGPIYDEFDRIEDLVVHFRVDGRETDAVTIHDTIEIEYSFRLRQRVTDLNVSLVFLRKDGTWLTAISTLNGDLLKHRQEGKVHCKVKIRDFHFNPGAYVLVMPVHEGRSYLYRSIIKEFVVVGGPRFTWHLTDFAYDYDVIDDRIAETPSPPPRGEQNGADAGSSDSLTNGLRVIQFPYDLSMGTVKIRQSGSRKWEWRIHGDALGKVFVPDGNDILLEVPESAGRGLHRLTNLGGDDLFGLHLSRTKVTDEDLQAIAGLTGLQSLELRNTAITDDALPVLRKLHQLRTVALPARISRGAIENLKKELPHCHVIQ